MGTIKAPGDSATNSELSLSAVIIRCGCGDPDSHSKLGLPCPRPKKYENRGELAYWHPSILRRTARRLKRLFSHPQGD